MVFQVIGNYDWKELHFYVLYYYSFSFTIKKWDQWSLGIGHAESGMGSDLPIWFGGGLSIWGSAFGSLCKGSRLEKLFTVFATLLSHPSSRCWGQHTLTCDISTESNYWSIKLYHLHRPARTLQGISGCFSHQLPPENLLTGDTWDWNWDLSTCWQPHETTG